MRHRWLTLVTVAFLYGTYRLYAAALTPITQPEQLPEHQVNTRAVTEIKPSSIAGRMAERHLPPEQRWAAGAKYQWRRSEETFLYFKKYRRIEDDKQNRIRVSPFAMVWIERRRPEAEAYTLVCNSAEFEFESKFQFGQSPGRIIGGQLQGNVRLTGPDHLLIEGKDFNLSERDQRLYSDYPVRFAFGPQPGEVEQVRGSAASIDVTFNDHSGMVLGNDLPRIGGLRKATLRRDVSLELVMEESDGEVPVLITSQGPFTYNFEDLYATFEKDVTVDRRTTEAGEPDAFDRLRAENLAIRFDEAVPDNAATPNRRRRGRRQPINLDVTFSSLRATGAEVLLSSDEQELIAQMQDLRYNAKTRTIEMRHNAGRVQVHRRFDQLHCPTVRVTHDEGDQLVTADCEGTGRITRRHPDTDEVEMEVAWAESLQVAPDEEAGWDRLTIVGDGHLLDHAQQAGIIADVLTVWLDREALQTDEGDVRTTLAPSGGDDLLPVKRVVASSNVALVSPDVHVETQRLDADFVKGVVSSGAPKRNDAGTSASPGQSSRRDERSARQPISVTAEAVTGQFIIDPEQEKADVKQLTATTNVSISRASAGGVADDVRSEDPFAVDAETVTLTNDGGNHLLKLLGAPARIRHPEAEIEGNVLYLDRGNNIATVDGVGSLSVLVETDLEGRPLEGEKRYLMIRWDEGMRFDGQRADFLENVRSTLAESALLSSQMSVFLNRRLSFSDDRPGGDDLEIDRIRCDGQVTGEFREWDGTAWIGFRRLEVHDFEMERQSGEFRAQGPGVIHDWSRGGAQRQRVKLDATTSTSANQPLRNSEWPWDYTRVEFSGEMSGNHRDRYVTLDDRVEVMHGPVKKAFTVLSRDEEFSQATATERSKNAIFIGSDKLRVSLVGKETQEEETIQVVASGNAELEGLVFGGRAHSISYDESNGMFTLKGRGTDAFLWHQDSPVVKPREANSRIIQFVPSEKLILDGVRSIRGGL